MNQAFTTATIEPRPGSTMFDVIVDGVIKATCYGPQAARLFAWKYAPAYSFSIGEEVIYTNEREWLTPEEKIQKAIVVEKPRHDTYHFQMVQNELTGKRERVYCYVFIRAEGSRYGTQAVWPWSLEARAAVEAREAEALDRKAEEENTAMIVAALGEPVRDLEEEIMGTQCAKCGSRTEPRLLSPEGRCPECAKESARAWAESRREEIHRENVAHNRAVMAENEARAVAEYAAEAGRAIVSRTTTEEDPETLLAAQRAGLLDEHGIPTRKYWAIADGAR